MVSVSRRKFFGIMGASTAGAFALSPLQAFLAQKAMGQSATADPFGPLAPKLPANIDPRSTAVVDLEAAGAILEVPAGFEYCAFHVSGMRMSDGNLCPSDHDGMACFAGPRGTIILVQNHELSPGEADGAGFSGGTGLRKAYDRFDGGDSEGVGAGGCSNIIVDSRGRVLRDYVSLAGTIRNCAGGPTPWGTWISCEENTSTPADNEAITQKHGFNFEVPARGGQRNPVALEAMGRFNHEAVAVDAATGYIYETEDRGDSCIYRFKPQNPGNLASGGVLEALVIKGQPTVDTSTGFLSLKGQPLDVEWVELENVNPDDDTLRFEAQEKGAAIFRRGEGAWAGNGLIYWVCTSGGDAGNGQVWAYDDVTETVTLVVESTDETELDNPDNITVNPVDGSLYLLEDGGGEQFVVGVTPQGGLFKLCRNNLNTSEFAGGCFSADATKFFCNIQTPGITLMIYRTDGAPILV